MRSEQKSTKADQSQDDSGYDVQLVNGATEAESNFGDTLCSQQSTVTSFDGFLSWQLLLLLKHSALT